MKEEVDVPNSPLELCERQTTLEKRKKIGSSTEKDCMQTSLSGLGRRLFFSILACKCRPEDDHLQLGGAVVV